VKITCFSSFTFSYLNRARVLFSTVRKYHPDWRCVALIVDKVPSGFNFKIENEPFDEIVYAHDLNIPQFKSWLYRHNVIEVCTAVKGFYLDAACTSGDSDAVVYLDPDTALLNSLAPLESMLETSDIVLTPHQIDPDDDAAAIVDNEITSLKTGVFNLGFAAVRTSGEGARFARWWRDRCALFCFDDIPNGLFVDQRWCDHVPGLFDKVLILRDPGYNVASWNLSRRTVRIDKDGAITVNGAPLRFWHFTKLGPVGDVMTKRYAADNFEVYEIWSWYKRQVAAYTDERIPSRYWAYGHYANGVSIHNDERVLYRTRSDLQQAFPDPFRSGVGSFQQWLEHENVLR